MAFFMPPASYMERTPSSSMLPRRSDSLTGVPRAGAKPAAPTKPSVFQLVDDDLRDARRVVTHGQEDDLRTALTRMMSRVEEISALLKSAHVKQSETETQLALARSNLQMAQANTDLLDDALKRANASARSSAPPSGWRHSSADSSASGPAPETPTSPDSAGVAEPKREKEGFFASFGRAHGPPPQALAALRGQNHAASASMPSLLPAAGADAAAADAAKKQVEDLTKALDAERARSEKAAEDKTALEGELESLSQALFEEANKMVASERMRAAEAAEEATEAARQRDALAQALRVLEAENLALKASAARAGASGAPIAGPADGASSGVGAGSGGAEAPHRRRPSVASLAAPVARPPRSPLRRAASLSASSLSSGAGSRPSSPLVSSPLRAASRAGSSPHSSPHTSPGMSASASLPTLGTLGALGLSANGDDEPTPPAHARTPLPALAFEEATPPGTSAARPSQLSREGSVLARSGGDAPAPWKRPVPIRRATSQSTTRPDPDYHDPNLPDDDAPDAAAAPERATPPLFTLPPLPSFSALQSIAQSLPASPAAASAALSAWFDAPASAGPAVGGRSPPIWGISPSTSPSLGAGAGGGPGTSPHAATSSPIAIPARPASLFSTSSAEEQSPWADVLSARARPALSRMSSVSSSVGTSLGASLGRARDALAGLPAALDAVSSPSEDTVASASPKRRESPRLVGQRMSSFETAAFGRQAQR